MLGYKNPVFLEFQSSYFIQFSTFGEQEPQNPLGNKLECIFLPVCWVYQFPVAAVTNYHKCAGLKQQKLEISQCWRPEVHIRGAGRAMPPPQDLQRAHLSLSAFSGCQQSLACGYITPISASVFTSLLLLYVSVLPLSSKDTCDWTQGPPRQSRTVFLCQDP